MKVVIGPGVGGFALSQAALDYMIARGHAGAIAELARYTELADEGWSPGGDNFPGIDIARHDPLLIEVVETLGSESFGINVELQILEIPDGTDYIIDCGDDMAEYIAERHCTWHYDAESTNSTHMSDKTRVVTKQPIQPIVGDENHILRFKQNAIVRHLLDHGGIDLNAIGRMDFSDEDRAQFAQLIGYSICGFSELPYASEEVIEAVMRQANKVIGSGADPSAEMPGFRVPPEGWGTGWSAGTLMSIPEGSVLLDGCPVPEGFIDRIAGTVVVPLGLEVNTDTLPDSDRLFQVWVSHEGLPQVRYLTLNDLDMTDSEWDALSGEDKDALMRDIAIGPVNWGWGELIKDEGNG